MEKLTNQEEDIMLRIWKLGRCAVKQIMELLPEPRPPYTTVASIVNNLKRKEYVKAEHCGKSSTRRRTHRISLQVEYNRKPVLFPVPADSCVTPLAVVWSWSRFKIMRNKPLSRSHKRMIGKTLRCIFIPEYNFWKSSNFCVYKTYASDIFPDIKRKYKAALYAKVCYKSRKSKLRRLVHS